MQCRYAALAAHCLHHRGVDADVHGWTQQPINKQLVVESLADIIQTLPLDQMLPPLEACGQSTKGVCVCLWLPRG